MLSNKFAIYLYSYGFLTIFAVKIIENYKFI